MSDMVDLESFLRYVSLQKGPPPLGFPSWAALVDRMRGMPVEIREVMHQVSSTHIVQSDGEDYASWKPAKRKAMNADAALALREAQERGEASIEQRRRMRNYTGFGGITDIGILPHEYPEEYVKASRVWLEYSVRGGNIPTWIAEIMSRVSDQYFTPLDICRAMWTLALRVNGNPQRILEPSAGIGRFVQTGPAGKSWSLVELDPMMAEMLRYIYPSADVHEGYFERFARTKPEPFDLIIGNPPYGDRPPEMRQADGRDIDEAVDYFTLRSADMLTPGGSVCFIVPLAFLKNQTRTNVRTDLLRSCAFRGAAVIPSGAFPQVRDGTFVIMVWTRRPERIKRSQFNEREQAVANGEYLSLPEAADALCGGEWRTVSYGESRGQYLHGTPDLSRIGQLFLAPGPEAGPRRIESRATSAWGTPGADSSEVTETIETQIQLGLPVHRHLSMEGFPGTGPKPEIRYVDWNTVQFVWSTHRLWVGVQVRYDDGPDTYTLTNAIGRVMGRRAGPPILVGPEHPDHYGEDLAEPWILFPPGFLSRLRTPFVPPDQLSLTGDDHYRWHSDKFDITLGRIIKDLRGAAYDAMRQGAGVRLANNPYQDLVIQWVHDPGTLRTTGSDPFAVLGVYHRRDDGVPDLFGLLPISMTTGKPVGQLSFVYAGTRLARGADAQLEKIWGSNLVAQKFVSAAAFAEPLSRTPSGEVISPDQADAGLDELPTLLDVIRGRSGRKGSGEGQEPEGATGRKGSGRRASGKGKEVPGAAPDLEARVRAYLGLVAQNSASAESQRESVRQAVVEYLATHGNPHPRGPAAIRAVVSREGTLEPVLTERQNRRISTSFPPEDATIPELVAWWSERRGYATFEDLGVSDAQALRACIADPETMIEIRVDDVRFYAKWAYFTGPPSGRLAPLDAALGTTTLEPSLRRKLETQKTLILKQWASDKTLGEMDVTPRSPFVPLEALQDWINHVIYGDHLPRIDAERRIKLQVDDGMMSVVEDEALAHVSRYQSNKLADLYWLIGYYNRSTMVERLEGDPETTGVGKKASLTKNIHGAKGKTASAEEDRAYVQAFLDWVTQSSWVPTIEQEYNTSFAPSLMSAIPTTPVDLANPKSTIRLHPHQNQVVRRASLGSHPRSLLVAFDTGAGKTLSGIAICRRWKQIGAARRPLIVVPPSVQKKWYVDAKQLLPDAKIGLIGIDPNRESPDPPHVRLEKWLRFAAGEYDFAIVGHKIFMNDLEPSEAEATEILSDVQWARKKMGEKVADTRRQLQRIQTLEEQITQLESVTTYYQYKEFFPRAPRLDAEWQEHRDKKIAEMRSELDRRQAQLLEGDRLGTDKEVATVQQALRELMQTKPYRPSERAAAEDLANDEVDEDFGINAGGDEDEDAEGSAEEGETKKPKAKKKDIVQVPLPGLLKWDELGIDALIVDEAHKYKNLWYPAAQIDYVGKGEDELFSAKGAWDMLIKTSSVRRRHGGSGGVIFLTATPVTNSPLELYSLISMVAPEVFTNAKIYDKEAFIERYWCVEAKEVVKPSGEIKSNLALTGFKNLQEMMGLISGVFDRKSTKDLVDMGWLKDLPKAEPMMLQFKRDPAQEALVKTLVAVFIEWTKTSEQAKKETEGAKADPSAVLEGLPTDKWSVTPTGGLIRVGRARRENRPEVMNDPQTAFMAKNNLRMIWISMLDKVASDPRLILDYAAELSTRESAWFAKDRAVKQWLEDKRAGLKVPKKPPAAPKASELLTLELAQALLDELPLDAMREYYRTTSPPVDYYVSADKGGKTVYAAGSGGCHAAARKRAPARRAEPEPRTSRAQRTRENYVAKIRAVAEYVRDNLDRPRKGRCGHVVFLDFLDLHEQLKDALVEVAGIPEDRIAFITGAVSKPQRFKVSQQFNGRDRLVLNGQEVQSEIVPTYDVVIGTSSAMAEGIDLQRRSCAVHHLQLPWEPATVHQRNGRAVRQGNLMGSVEVIYYITERTFDATRYDKVARKAMWFDQMFSGVSATNNPAAAEDASKDLDEVILAMVLEDEEELRKRLETVRAARAVRLREQRLASAQKDWVLLNVAFERARNAVDAQRREALFAVAARRREAWRVSYPEFVIPGVLEQLNDGPVAADLEQGFTIRQGDVVVKNGSRNKITEIRAPNGFILTHRVFGRLFETWDPLHWVFGTAPAQSWTYDQERAALINELKMSSEVFNTLTLVARDLRPHLTDLWSEVLKVKLVNSRYQASVISPLFVMADGNVFLAYPLSDTNRLALAGKPVNGSSLFNWLERNDVTKVIVPTDPIAWNVWLAAFREDRILMPTVGGISSYSLEVGGSVGRARASKKTWEEYTRTVFGKTVPTETFKQRQTVTREP